MRARRRGAGHRPAHGAARLRRRYARAVGDAHRECAHRFVEALESLLAERLVEQRQTARYGLVNRALQADTARFGQLLESLRDDDAAAGYRLLVNNDFAHCDTDAQLGSNRIVKPAIVGGVVLLEGERRAYRVGGAREFGNQRIASQFVGNTAVILNRLRETHECVLHALVRARLVELYQPGRADDVGV